MFIKRLTLESVRCFDHLDLDLSEPEGGVRHRAVIVGENGSGKSTVLRAAALVTCGSDALTELLGDPRSWVRLGVNDCLIEADLGSGDDQVQVRLEIRADDTVSDVIHRSKSTLEPLNRLLRVKPAACFVAGYGTSRRLSSERTLRQRGAGYRHARALNVATLFDNDAMLVPLESWAMEVEYRLGQSGTEMVGAVLDRFMPGARFERIDRKDGRLLFRTRDGLVPLRHLSDGYQNVAAWIGDLVSRIVAAFDGCSEPLGVDGLLLVDEIDLHLHPLWQRSLHSFLSQNLPNFQTVLTTHSAVTAQQSGDGELYYLERGNNGDAPQLRLLGADPSRLLVSQLLMTEAFGLESDESLAVEARKREYRVLRDKEELDGSERQRLDVLKEELSEIAQGGASGLRLQDEQMALLRVIQQELRSGPGAEDADGKVAFDPDATGGVIIGERES